MPRILTSEECVARGVEPRSRLMENGEYRDSLTVGGNHGIGYILTTMPSDSGGGWQNAHFHVKARETYVVQKGWIASALLLVPGGEPIYRIFREGGVFTTQPMQAHNVYMPAGAVIHTVRHGDVTGEKDWFASEELDRLSKRLAEADILRLAAE